LAISLTALLLVVLWLRAYCYGTLATVLEIIARVTSVRTFALFSPSGGMNDVNVGDDARAFASPRRMLYTGRTQPGSTNRAGMRTKRKAQYYFFNAQSFKKANTFVGLYPSFSPNSPALCMPSCLPSESRTTTTGRPNCVGSPYFSTIAALWRCLRQPAPCPRASD
jgi:hypothetical protein